MTDYKALCSELLLFGEQAISEREGLWPNCDRNNYDLLLRARAALAEPESVGPSDAELVQFAFREKLGRLDSNGNIITRYYYPMDIGENVIDFARAVLARWGNLAPEG